MSGERVAILPCSTNDEERIFHALVHGVEQAPRFGREQRTCSRLACSTWAAPQAEREHRAMIMAERYSPPPMPAETTDLTLVVQLRADQQRTSADRVRGSGTRSAATSALGRPARARRVPIPTFRSGRT
jgi:hypothetical protein